MLLKDYIHGFPFRQTAIVPMLYNKHLFVHKLSSPSSDINLARMDDYLHVSPSQHFEKCNFVYPS